jgi:limonene-1,2-epoxide hydrolase
LISEENQMGQAGETVLGMIEAFNRINIDDILNYFAEDAVYHNMPMEPLTGSAAIRAGLSGFLGEATKVEWVVLNLLEDSAGTVLTERVDKFEVNGHWVELPVMGTFEVRSGRIQAWRDYFDLGDFQRQMAAAQGQG